MTNEVIVQDPLGKMVHLLAEHFLADIESTEIYDDAATVIKKPAIMVEVTENNETQFYYFRSVGWNSTLLIAVHFNNGQWDAYEVKRNPPSEILLDVLKKGKQVF